MAKHRVAVGVVMGPIHFAFHDDYGDQELDTLGKVIYKYALTDHGVPLRRAVAVNNYVLIDDEWKNVQKGYSQIYDAMKQLRVKAGILASSSMLRRCDPRTDLSMLLPLQGE